MKILQIVKQFLRRGQPFSLGPYRISLKISKVRPLKASPLYIDGIYRRQVEYLIAKFPKLKEVSLDPKVFGYKKLFDLYISIVPALDGQASEVNIRNVLSDYRGVCDAPCIIGGLDDEIARSNLRCGMPERALRLKRDLVSGYELDRQVENLNKSYGFEIVGRSWPDYSRGSSLVYFFRNHLEKIKFKKILHLSPEPELKVFFENLTDKYAIVYDTSNLFGEGLDYLQDLTAMNFQNDSYDLIICHRVLEHVLDDVAALSEIYRCLRVGGVLNISVPQSLHIEKTLDWVVPDKTHHEHVRQYGRDFSQRLLAAGFDVTVNNWLLGIPEEEMSFHHVYPLRFYEAIKKKSP